MAWTIGKASKANKERMLQEGYEVTELTEAMLIALWGEKAVQQEKQISAESNNTDSWYMVYIDACLMDTLDMDDMNTVNRLFCDENPVLKISLNRPQNPDWMKFSNTLSKRAFPAGNSSKIINETE